VRPTDTGLAGTAPAVGRPARNAAVGKLCDQTRDLIVTLFTRALARLTGLAFLSLACVTQVHATSTLYSAFGTRYPASGTRMAAGCDTCHAGNTSVSSLNAYGRDLHATSAASADQRLAAIEGVDSDQEGHGNLVEINASTQPGWCVATTPGCDNNGATPPAMLKALDPPAANQPPVSRPGGPYSGVLNAAIAFNGATSSDPDGTVASYAWNFGDGSTGTGATPSHSYTGVGTYTVTLTVTDNGGLTNSATTTATVSTTSSPQPPTARSGGPYSGTVNVALAFNGSSSSDPDGSVVSHDWNFGDGGTASGAQVMHTYATAGTYTVTLTVTDDSGLTASATTTAAVATPANDGATLYLQNCADCHGDPWSGAAVDAALPGTKRVTGARACTIHGAIFGTSVFPGGVHDMVAYGNQSLSTAAIDAIAGYLNSRDVTGEQRYVTACAGCHGNDARGGRTGEGVVGEGIGSIHEGIGEVHAMRYLDCLPDADVSQVSTHLKSLSSGGGGSGGGDGGDDGGGGAVDFALLLGAMLLALTRVARPTRHPQGWIE
jgi:chitodextrinase